MPWTTAESFHWLLATQNVGKIYVKKHIPIVHLEPVHPAVHAQVLDSVQVPPLEQDVAPEHLHKQLHLWKDTHVFKVAISN